MRIGFPIPNLALDILLARQNLALEISWASKVVGAGWATGGPIFVIELLEFDLAASLMGCSRRLFGGRFGDLECVLGAWNGS